MKVWDRPVRSLHWALAACVIAAWVTGHVAGLAQAMHEVPGYAAGAVVLLRLAWGFSGSRYARFAQFVRSPAVTWAYLGDVLHGRAARYLGHNPLGGWMVVLLLSCVGALSITGILYMTDWLWGYEWLYRLHAALGWLVLALVVLHLAGVAFTSWHHKENLVRAMVLGDKPEPHSRDVV